MKTYYIVEHYPEWDPGNPRWCAFYGFSARIGWWDGASRVWGSWTTEGPDECERLLRVSLDAPKGYRVVRVVRA